MTRYIPIGDVELRLDMIARALGIPAATLDKLASGEWVAVPREASPDLWPTYCAENQAMPGSAWDTLSQKLYRAIIRHYGSKEKANG